jgi:hypothetical protein
MKFTTFFFAILLAWPQASQAQNSKRSITCRQRGHAYSIRLGALPFCKKQKSVQTRAPASLDAAAITFSSYLTANAQEPALNPRYQNQNAFEVPPPTLLPDKPEETPTPPAANAPNGNAPASSNGPSIPPK